MGTFNRSTTLAPVVASNGWYQYTMSIPSGVSGNSYIIFHAASEYGNNMFLDDIRITELTPPCNAPTSLTASNITSNSAELGWTNNSIATAWDVEYDISGFTPTGVPTLTSVLNPHEITNLTANTSYDFYVRSSCGVNNFSSWAGPFTFNTTHTKQLNLTVLLQGLYNVNGTMNQAHNDNAPEFSAGISDKITVELHDALTLVTVHYQNSDVMLHTDGTATLTDIPAGLTDEYYIVVKHRNSVETWSKFPVSFTGTGSVDYNFTTAATQAYGDNMIAVQGGFYAIYSGDINTDGTIDGSDLSEIDNALTLILEGYIPEDINGDGKIDATDVAFIDDNATRLIHLLKP